MDDLFRTVEDALSAIHISVCVHGELEEPRLLLENILQRMHRLYPVMYDSANYLSVITSLEEMIV